MWIKKFKQIRVIALTFYNLNKLENFFLVYKLIISLEINLKAADGAENYSASIKLKRLEFFSFNLISKSFEMYKNRNQKPKSKNLTMPI